MGSGEWFVLASGVVFLAIAVSFARYAVGSWQMRRRAAGWFVTDTIINATLAVASGTLGVLLLAGLVGAS